VLNLESLEGKEVYLIKDIFTMNLNNWEHLETVEFQNSAVFIYSNFKVNHKKISQTRIRTNVCVNNLNSNRLRRN